jgi:hypothetical protein
MTNKQFAKDGDIVTATRGRGRPPIGPSIHVRLPADLLAEIDRLAETSSEKRSETARRLIVDGLRTITSEGVQ